jgi:hypothetical protein
MHITYTYAYAQGRIYARPLTSVLTHLLEQLAQRVRVLDCGVQRLRHDGELEPIHLDRPPLLQGWTFKVRARVRVEARVRARARVRLRLRVRGRIRAGLRLRLRLRLRMESPFAPAGRGRSTHRPPLC